ncbi:hypothetical protein QQX98_010581 [Neonectria punicea]|uniref:Uncharacterized protein n=1 Tax=Neonectria punicea TaxID=979145 RepID=A0ABR1GPJ1_9HYPO
MLPKKLLSLAFWVSMAFTPVLGKRMSRTDRKINKLMNPACLDTSKTLPYEDYFGCKPKRKLKKGGHCPPDWYHNCTGYCEFSTQWSYGLESPFPRSSCSREDCRLMPEIRNDISRTWNWTALIKPITLTVGSHMNFLSPNMTTGSISLDKPAKVLHDCGYWTFIPHMVK